MENWISISKGYKRSGLGARVGSKVVQGWFRARVDSGLRGMTGPGRGNGVSDLNGYWISFYGY